MITQPLTVFSEEEQLFAASVREFAEAEIKPFVREMDAQGKLKPEIISKCFDLGLMSIEPPEVYGGAGGTIFMACLAIEELARIDPSLSVFVDVQNTRRQQCAAALGQRRAETEIFAKAGDRHRWRVCAERSQFPAPMLSPCRPRATESGDHYLLNGRKLWITNALEAGVFILFATLDPSKGYKGITAFIVEKDL